MLQDKVFIIKFLPIDRFASCAVMVGEVSSLAHELGDDAMEAAPLKTKPVFMSAQTAEVLYNLKQVVVAG